MELEDGPFQVGGAHTSVEQEQSSRVALNQSYFEETRCLDLLESFWLCTGLVGVAGMPLHLGLRRKHGAGTILWKTGQRLLGSWG